VPLGQKLGGQADELETSLVLAIEPGSVRLDRAVPDYGNMLDAPATVFYQPTVFSGDPASGLDYSRTGARGDPTLATAEKGEAVLTAMARELVDGIRALFPDPGLIQTSVGRAGGWGSPPGKRSGCAA